NHLHHSINAESTERLTETRITQSNFLKVLFDLDNVRQTLTAFFRPRGHNIRLQIYLLSFVLFSQTLVTDGVKDVMLQFVQKVYFWSSEMYTIITAVQMIFQMVMLGVLSIFLVKCFKLADSTLIMVALA